MVFRCKCFEFLSLATEFGNIHNGQTQSSQTKSSSADTYYSAYADMGVSSTVWPNDLEVFTYLELEEATNNFSPSSKIGEGAVGSIYKGVIQYPNKKLQVMVKHLNERYTQGRKEWATEVNYIGSVKHPNLVKLVGYCSDGSGFPRLLVYEYLPKGSVRNHLLAEFEAPLPWPTRLKIAQDAAFGLAYLHGAMDFQFIFGNFRSSNILLDEHWNAKLFYSFIDQSCLSEGPHNVLTTAVKNSGYDVTCMSDVWSYGVILCELITGSCCFFDQSEQEYVEQMKPYLNSSECIRIMGLRLAGQHLQSVEKLLKIAKRCLAKNPKARPTMIKVLDMVNRVTSIKAEGKRRFIERMTRLCSLKLKSSP